MQALRVIPGILLVSLSTLSHFPAFAAEFPRPPAAPAPNTKSLDQIEPRIDLQNAPASAVTISDPNYHFIITQPGSYYLAGNPAATKVNAIEISLAGATLDVNAFPRTATNPMANIVF